MPIVNKDGSGTHGYAMPVALIAVLLFGYWIISEWHSLPGLIDMALAKIR